MRNIIPVIQWLITTLKHAWSHRCQQKLSKADDGHVSATFTSRKHHKNLYKHKITFNLCWKRGMQNKHKFGNFKYWVQWRIVSTVARNYVYNTHGCTHTTWEPTLLREGGGCMWPTFNPHPRDSVIRLLLTLCGPTRWVRAVVPHGCVWMQPDCGDLLTAVHATNAQLLVNDRDERVTVWLEQRLSWIVSHNS